MIDAQSFWGADAHEGYKPSLRACVLDCGSPLPLFARCSGPHSHATTIPITKIVRRLFQYIRVHLCEFVVEIVRTKIYANIAEYSHFDPPGGLPLQTTLPAPFTTPKPLPIHHFHELTLPNQTLKNTEIYPKKPRFFLSTLNSSCSQLLYVRMGQAEINPNQSESSPINHFCEKIYWPKNRMKTLKSLANLQKTPAIQAIKTRQKRMVLMTVNGKPGALKTQNYRSRGQRPRTLILEIDAPCMGAPNSA
jgi:hypothetical protein